MGVIRTLSFNTIYIKYLWKHLFILHFIYNFLLSLKIYTWSVFFFFYSFNIFIDKYSINVNILCFLFRYKTLQLLTKKKLMQDSFYHLSSNQTHVWSDVQHLIVIDKIYLDMIKKICIWIFFPPKHKRMGYIVIMAYPSFYIQSD